MKKVTFILLLSVFTGFALQKGDLARFHRILKGFDYPEYRDSDRDLYLDFQYESDKDDDIPEEPDITYESRISRVFSRNVNGDLGVSGDWTVSNPVKRTDQSLNLKIFGNVNENSSIRNVELLDLFDTTANRNTIAGGHLSYIFNHEHEFGLESLNGWPFWGIEGDAGLNGSREKMGDYNHSENYFLNSNYIANRADFYSAVEPCIGLGNTKPVRPVYQAFLVEHKLKEAQAVKGNLTDSTVYKLSALIGSVRAYKLRNEKYLKYFMESLQKILSTDSSVIDSSLNAFTMFKVNEVFSTDLPFFYTGFSARLLMSVRGNSEWKNVYSSHADVSESGFNFDLDYGPFVELEWTYPVFPRLFVSLALRSPLSLSSVKPDFHNQAWLEKMEGNAELYYLFLDRLILWAGIEAWNNKYTEERNFGMYLTTRFYLEDRVSIQCTMRKTGDRRSYEDIGTSMKNTNSAESVVLGLNYDF